MAYPVLLLLAASSLPCNWQVKRQVDPMTDKASCVITSYAAHVGLSVSKEQVLFVTGSPYREDYLTLRVDDQPAIMLRDARSTRAYPHEARDVLAQILTGVRIRTSYRGSDGTVNGDAAICNLPELIRSCQQP